MEWIRVEFPYVGVSENKGYRFGDPHNKGYSILGSTLGSPPIYGNYRLTSIVATLTPSLLLKQSGWVFEGTLPSPKAEQRFPVFKGQNFMRLWNLGRSCVSHRHAL